MAEVNEDQEVNQTPNPPSFLEVFCKSSGKIRRFSAGTEADFAVNLINKKLLNDEFAMASHIEAVKDEDEESVSFGPNSKLVDYGPGWKLQTVVESYGDAGEVNVRRRRVRKVSTKEQEVDDSDSAWSIRQSPLTCHYIAKALFAFLLLFVFGAAFTLVLENLPRFILYVNSSV